MRRVFLAAAITCLFVGSAALAGEPAVPPPVVDDHPAGAPAAQATDQIIVSRVEASDCPVTRLTRKQIEAMLAEPAELNLGSRPTVTVGELLRQLHERHHLSIRYDIPSLTALYGLDATHPSVDKSTMPYASWLPGSLSLMECLAPVAIVPSNSTAYPVAATNAPPVTLPPDLKPAPTTESKAPPLPTSGAPIVAAPACPTCPAPVVTTPVPQEKSASPQDFVTALAGVEVPIATVNARALSVATALRLALDAAPQTDASDSGGMPLPLTNAALLDFVVEDDGVLITTRLKALTYKETRVYTVKNLKDVSPDELAIVIRQSIRPWSWRSRIDELGNKLKTGLDSTPPDTFAALAKSGIKLASAETGIEMDSSDEITPKSSRAGKSDLHADDKSEPAKTHPAEASKDDDEMRQAAMLGRALVDTLVTAAHFSLNALEVMHYADPPTGSIQVLPGRLVITQSQAAHREIADLLKQLSEE